MRLATTLLPAVHALRVHRLRTGLALLGICFGVAAVILIVAWGSISVPSWRRRSASWAPTCSSSCLERLSAKELGGLVEAFGQ